MTSTTYGISRAYQKLLRRFPLRPIRNEREYDLVTNIAQEMIARKGINVDERGYFDTLLLLIQDYEARQYDFDQSKITGLEALKRLIEVNDTKQADLAAILGSQSAASMILTGRRAISKNNARTLAEHFKVDAGLFLLESSRRRG